LPNLGLTKDIGEHHCVLKMPYAILGPSSLPVIVAQLDKTQQSGPFYVGVVWQMQSVIFHRKEEGHYANKQSNSPF